MFFEANPAKPQVPQKYRPHFVIIYSTLTTPSDWLGAELHLRHTYIMFSCTHFLVGVAIFRFSSRSDLFLRRVRAVVSVLLSARTVHLPGPSGGVSHAALLLLLLLLPLCAWPGPVSCGCLNARSLIGGTGTSKIFPTVNHLRDKKYFLKMKSPQRAFGRSHVVRREHRYVP